MSPLLDRQRRATELGRIRMGTKIVAANGKVRPARLDTFRLTSPDRAKIEAVAALYGGEVKPWQSPTGPAWEVVTSTAELPVQMPPGEPISQFYEQHGGGGMILRRCDGIREEFSRSDCKCPADLEERKMLATQDPPAACKPRTRLSLILAEVPGLGVWVLTSTGDQAADELAGVSDLLHQAAVRGVMLPATLRLTKRETKNRGEVKRYVVPVLDVAESFGALMRGEFDRTALGASPARPALPSGTPTPPEVQTSTPPEVVDGQVIPNARAQQIVDEALDPASKLGDAREYWSMAAAEGLLEAPVQYKGMHGRLGDLLTVHMQLLAKTEPVTPTG